MKFCFVCSNSSCINQGCLYLPCQAGYSQEEWTPLLTHEKMAGHRDAQSHALCKLNQNNCKQNSPWDSCQLEALVVSSKPWIDACWWKGEYKLYHSVWEPPIMCVAWKISPSLGCYVDNESIPLKILFTSISKPSSGTSTNPCFPLRRAYLFTFMLSHHPLIKKHQLESTAVICIHYCQFTLSMT